MRCLFAENAQIITKYELNYYAYSPIGIYKLPIGILALATDVYGISGRTVFKNIPDVYKKLLTIWDKSHII